MPIKIKLLQQNDKFNVTDQKWYARTIVQEEIHTRELAAKIQAGTTFTRPDIIGIIEALVVEMNHQLRDGKTVVLDNFGRFRLTAVGQSVDSPEQFSVKQHIHHVKCRFLPAGERNATDWKVRKTFTHQPDIEMLPYYNPNKKHEETQEDAPTDNG